MSFDFFDTEKKTPAAPTYLQAWPDRSEDIRVINDRDHWDVVVVGGGIHGATMAHLCALNGLSTVLLERNDYAGATSSSSSKMAHGGLRYLEFFDFGQVLEGIHAREALYRTAGGIVKPCPFFIPVADRERWFRLKLGLGLTFYDFLVKDRARKHRFVKKGDASLDTVRNCGGAADRFSQGYIYYDGLLSDTRLTLEHIVAARQEGAYCLNHASLVSFSHRPSGTVDFGWRDNLSNQSYEGSAGIVVNCAGPWVPSVGRARPSVELRSQVIYSKGVHLLFNRRWEGPALFLPLEGKSRYYFVWPHFAGTLVGTTEREIETPTDSVAASAEEVSEVLDRLKKDLPESGLTRESCHYCFAGLRTLPVQSGGGSSALVSRRQRWVFQAGMLSLIGGKLTTAVWTAEQGLRDVFKLAGIRRPIASIKSRVLPGTALLHGSFEDFKARARERGISDATFQAVIGRIGSRIRHLLDDEELCEEICPGVLRGEIELALNVDQAVTLDDMMRRRLGLELMPGHGLASLAAISGCMKTLRPDFDRQGEEQRYREKIERIVAIIHPGSTP